MIPTKLHNRIAIFCLQNETVLKRKQCNIWVFEWFISSLLFITRTIAPRSRSGLHLMLQLRQYEGTKKPTGWMVKSFMSIGRHFAYFSCFVELSFVRNEVRSCLRPKNKNRALLVKFTGGLLRFVFFTSFFSIIRKSPNVIK